VKSHLSKAAVLGLAALVCAGVVRAQPITSAHWKSTTEMTGGPQGDMTTESELWLKDKKLRIKTTVMGMNMNVVKTGDVLYQWQEGQATGMKMPANLRRRGPSTDYVSKIDDIRTKGKKIRTETVAGKECDVYEYTETAGDRSAMQTYWLAKAQKNFPLKVVSENGNMKTTTTNHDVDLGASVPDSLLAVPDDVRFQDMSEMMKGRPAQRQN
jgi:hypothetical protein